MPSSSVDLPVPFSPTMMVIGAVEIQLEFVLQERQAERIGRAVGDAGWVEPDAPEVRRGHADGTVSF